MVSLFPIAADNLPANHVDQTPTQTEYITAAIVNNLAASVNALETALLPGGPLTNYNVKQYGALGNGVANDTVAFNNAINAAATTSGVVFVPAGTYNVNQVLLKSNVWLQGAGEGRSVIRNLTGTPSMSIVLALNCAMFAISDLTIQGATNSDYMQPLNISNCSDGRVLNVLILGGTHYGCCIQLGSTRIQMSNVTITGQRKNPSFVTGGTGLWLYSNVTDCVITNLDVYDCDGSGVIFDAGTSDGLGIVTQRNSISNFVIRNVGQQATYGHGMEVEGAQYCTFSNFVIDTSGHLGILLNVDQASIPSNHNTFVNGIIRNTQTNAINIYGSVGNAFSNIQLRNFNINNAGSPYPIVLQQSTSYGNQSPDDNVFENFVIDNSGGANYQYGVAIVAGTLHAYRNKFRNMSWGTPSSSTFVTFDTEARVPLNGPNGNVIEGRVGIPLADNVHDSPMRLYGGDGPPSNAVGQDGDQYLQGYPRVVAGVNQPSTYRKDAGAWVSLQPVRNTGTAVFASGTTSLAVTHNLGAAPARVLITPVTDPLSTIRFWVSAKGATTFTITSSSAPGSNVTFDWLAQTTEG